MHNSREYITKALESILKNKTKRKIEIIAVDDNSTDGTSEIVEKILENSSVNWKLINLDENIGPAGARNVGLKYAKGRYIQFLDSDDFIHPLFIETMCSVAERGYDVVFSDFSLIFPNGRVKRICSNRGSAIKKNTEKNLIQFLMGEIRLISSNLIIRRALLKTHRLKFLEGIRYLEDPEFNFRVLASAEYIKYVPQPLVFYVQRPNSHSRVNSKKISKTIRDILYVKYSLRLFLRRKGMEVLIPYLNVYIGTRIRWVIEDVLVTSPQLGKELINRYYYLIQDSIDNTIIEYIRKILVTKLPAAYTILRRGYDKFQGGTSR